MKNIILLASSRSGHNFTGFMIRSWCPDDRFFQFEAISPEDFERNKDRRNVCRGIETITVIQVRDYLNFSASWVKFCLNRGDAWKEDNILNMLDTWLKITKEAMYDSDYIGNKITLIYDQFVQNESYRKAVCSLLDGEYSEAGLEIVATGGQGSSFDHFTLQGNGSAMKVVDRWEWWLSEEAEEFLHLLKVKKNILEYYTDQFDLSPGQSKLVNEILK